MTALKLITLGFIALVLIVLVIGIVSMAIGGKFNSKWSNRLMQYRVLFQLIAILLLALLFLTSHHN